MEDYDIQHIKTEIESVEEHFLKEENSYSLNQKNNIKTEYGDTGAFHIKEESEFGSCVYIKDAENYEDIHIKEKTDSEEVDVNQTIVHLDTCANRETDYYRHTVIKEDTDSVNINVEEFTAEPEIKHEYLMSDFEKNDQIPNGPRKVVKVKMLVGSDFPFNIENRRTLSLLTANPIPTTQYDTCASQNKNCESSKLSTYAVGNLWNKSDEETKVTEGTTDPILQSDAKIKKIFKCSLCTYETDRKPHLTRHLFVHSNIKLFKCSECHFSSNDKSSLKRHLLSHVGIKVFKCSECRFSCNHKGSLKAHSLTHSGIKNFKCSECDYSCNRKGNLKFHLLSHTGEKLFSCSQCNYSCNQKRYLKVHLLTHEGVKLFKCSECDYSCNLKHRLKVHLLSHTDVKFKCSKCNYSSKLSVNLNRHMLKHSGDAHCQSELTELV